MTEKILLLIQAMRDERTPWYAKTIVILILAYIISPIDIIPDFIPVLGLLDEVILVHIAFTMVYKMIPESVKQEQTSELDERLKKRLQIAGTFLILLIWTTSSYVLYELITPDLFDSF